MKAKTAERIVSSKIIRVAISLALALSVCVVTPVNAFAAGSVNVTIGDDIPYAGYSTTHMYADGEVAYCADPSAATPSPGTYSKSSVSDPDLIATMWFSYGAPGFDASMFPDSWYDGSGWSAEKYIVASHVLLSYAYQDSKADAVFGTSGDFEDWARGELLGTTWKSIKASKGKVSTGFEAFCIHTGPGTQVLMSFTWDKGGLKVAKADSQAGAEPQGDAALSGAKYDIVNSSGKYALVDGRYYASGEVVKTITGHWDGGAGAYIAKTASNALPCGTYTVVESEAPEGYLVSDWSAKAEINSDGQVVDLTSSPCDDDVIRGGVQVTKSDVELGASEALGGNSHDALDTGSTLSGIEFTIANASERKVLVGDKWFEPGDAIETIATAWNDEVGAYTAQTAADELPYGTYTIQETKTNDSYLLIDGTPRTFQVRAEGVLVAGDRYERPLEFFDQVVRNDLEIVKMAEDTNASLQVAFKVTNVSTGESHVLVTDRNGNVSTASSWNRHSDNTNGNDGLLSSESIKAADMDPRAGVWFSLGEDGSNAAVDDGLSALPYGKYLLEELRSDSNEGYDLVTKTFVIERDSTAAKPVWMSLDDKEGPKIQTEETDKADGDHVAQAAEQVTLVDTVWYENLKTDGTQYTLTGTLMVKSTGEPLLDADGNPVTATTTFKARTASGEVELEFTFDGSLLAGEDIVAFESMVSDGIEVAVHADISDEDQTVHFLDIRTTAADQADGDKLVTGTEITDAADGDQIIVTGKVKLIDTVEYKGLVAGDAYTVHGTLMVKSTGEALADAEGNPVVASAEFVAEKANGTVDVTFEFDASSLNEGDYLVAFEECLTAEGNLAAAHQDIDDAGQTVVVDNPDTPEVPKTPYDKTGATAPVSTIGILALVGAVLAGAGAAALALMGRRKKGDAGESEPDEEVTE